MSNIRKVIFLDIDGVMKPARSYFDKEAISNFDGGFDPLAVKIINHLCERTGAEIVFNTVWNRHREPSIEEIAVREGITAKIAGKTKYPDTSVRLTAILDWVDGEENCLWVALDDVVMGDRRAIAVDSENGISVENYRQATDLLGNYDYFRVLL